VPRPYQLGKRQAQIDEARRRVVEAARALLADATSYTDFTVDAVARRADVARATVYYQFGSKTGLIEALCDSLAENAGLGPERMGAVFAEQDPREALHELIAIFAGFWSADRSVMRRLRAIGALDPEVGAVIAARDERLHTALSVLLERIPHREGAPRLAQALMGFDLFDALAGSDRSPIDVVEEVVRLVDDAVTLRARRTRRATH
jgi:AcrR family transcriptional regulator